MLDSVHPGHTVEEVRDNTGFDFDVPEGVGETPLPENESVEPGPIITLGESEVTVVREGDF